MGGDDADVQELDLDDGPVTLVIGPPGSGRTSALRCIEAGLRQLGEPVLVVSREDGAEAAGLAPLLATALREQPTAVVLLDGVPAEPDPDATGTGARAGVGAGVAELLTAHIRSAGHRTGRLVIACEAAEVLTAYRGLLTVACGVRRGLLLGRPGPAEAEVFGLRPGPRPDGPPGRALLIRAGRVTTVQLALPPGPAPTTRTSRRSDDRMST